MHRCAMRSFSERGLDVNSLLLARGFSNQENCSYDHGQPRHCANGDSSDFARSDLIWALYAWI